MAFQVGEEVFQWEKWGKIPAGSTVVYLEDCDCMSQSTDRCSFIVVEFRGDKHWVPQGVVRQHARKSWFDIWS